jgi:hypothetical protein
MGMAQRPLELLSRTEQAKEDLFLCALLSPLAIVSGAGENCHSITLDGTLAAHH